MTERIVRIRIELRHTKPKIWRRIDVPLSYTLTSLHEVIMAAFGWHGGHMFEFEIMGQRYSAPSILDDALDWDVVGPKPVDSGTVGLLALVTARIKKFNYTYDFGDDWRHIITILRVMDASPGIDYPALVAGARRAPIDDIGGVWGFYNLAEAAADPNHPDRKELEEWHGKEFMDNFDLEEFDDESVRMRLASLARRAK